MVKLKGVFFFNEIKDIFDWNRKKGLNLIGSIVDLYVTGFCVTV